MPFFIKAQSNESIILKTFGIPTNIARSWSFIPFPCCQVARRINLGRYILQFECVDVITQDDVNMSLIFSTKFVVDRSSKTKIMKAYKDMIGDEYDDTENEVINLETKVLEIIYRIVKKHASKMNFKEIVKFNWIYVDSIFTETKYVLKDSNVILIELTMDEINKCEMTEKKSEMNFKTKAVNTMCEEEIIQQTTIEEVQQVYESPASPQIVIDLNKNSFEALVDNTSVRSYESHVSKKNVHLKPSGRSVTLHNNQIRIDTGRDNSDTISIISIDDKSLSRQVSVLYKDDVPTDLFIRGISVSSHDQIESDLIGRNGEEMTLPKPTVTDNGVMREEESSSLVVKRKKVERNEDDVGNKLVNVLNKEEPSLDDQENLEMYESCPNDGVSKTFSDEKVRPNIDPYPHLLAFR